MRKFIAIFVLSFIFLIPLFAQVGIDVRNYKLNEIPFSTPAEDSLYKNEKGFGLVFKYVYDYYVNEDKKFEFWELEHKAIKVYDEEFGKGYDEVSFGYINPDNIHKIVLRIIKDGEVLKTFGKKDIEKITDEGDGDETPKIVIKVPDIEVGSIVEYLIIFKSDDITQSDGIYMQYAFPFKNVNFTTVMPEHLKPYFQVYNGNYPVLDTIIESKELRYTTVHIDQIAGIDAEPESFYKKHNCRVEFNIAYNLDRSKLRMNTTKDFVNGFYDRVQLTDKDLIKIVKKELIKKIKFDKNTTDLEKIIQIENFLKEQIGRGGIGAIQTAKIWGYIFDHFDINFDIVLTSDKTEKAFDKNFNGTNFYEHLLFYFPSVKYYIAPMEYSSRNGLIPMNYTDNTAIFLKKTLVDKNIFFKHTFTTLPKGPEEQGKDVLKLNYKIDPVAKAITGTIEREIGSYVIHRIQANFNNFEVEDREQIIEIFLSFDSESSNISDEEFINVDPKDVGKNPMIFKATMKNTEWVKFENNTIEVAIGKMIGKQSRLENKKPRQLPVEKEYANSYDREIIIEIPEGYKIEDPSKLAYVKYDNDTPANATAAFISEYKIEGNKLIVTIKEYYNKSFYSLEEYPLYERVANASADFNDIKIKFIK
jgi:hypothetical protein